MENFIKNITGKDEKKAQEAACFMIDNSSADLFKLLVEKTDFLFDFVKNNVYKRIENAVNKDNFMNLINFFDIYSPYYDDLFASILAKHANEDLTDKIFELLENGTIQQKKYAAKYFVYIPDTVALEPLSKYAFSDDEDLCFNSAQALGQMQDDISYDIALALTESNDDFEKLKAVKFFTAYGNDFPLKEIFMAMKTSKLPENIAGQIPYAESLLKLLESDYVEDTLITIDYIISGLGEILPLADIFQFEMYDVLNKLINENKEDNEYSGKIAQILLEGLSKFKEFCENQEYIFDEDKNTKNEINEINNLLNSCGSEFWDKQKKFILKELKTGKEGILSALRVIKDYKLKTSIPVIKELLNETDETVVCEAATTLSILGAKEEIDFNSLLQSIKNPNIKAVIESLR